MIRRPHLAFALISASLACSSGGGSGATGGSGGGASGTGGGGGGGAAAPLAYKPCDESKRVGGFSVTLKRNQGSTPFSAIGGGVRDAVDPKDIWQEMAKEGDCRLLVGPMLVCNAPECKSEEVCAGANKCIPAPVSQNVGNVTLTGLGAAMTLMPVMASGITYHASITDRYPPFGAEAEVGMKTEGGKYPAFTLAGRGIEPLEFAGTGIKVMRNQPLAFTWTSSGKNKSARIHVKLDIAHHGGVAARINCEMPDTGSGTIAAGLVTKLLERGAFGFPTIALTRQTVDSTTIAPGCVDFVVASEEVRDIEVEGVISCNTTDQMPTCPPDEEGCKACPAGMKCGHGFRCMPG